MNGVKSEKKHRSIFDVKFGTWHKILIGLILILVILGIISRPARTIPIIQIYQIIR